MSGPLSCGVDFGTSNSAVAVAKADGAKLVPLEKDRTTLPSAIFFTKSGPVFGRAGIEAYTYGEEGRLMRGLKKILGTALMDDKTVIGGRSVSLTEILHTFLHHLKDKADNFAGSEVENVVMGRPVHFHDNDPAADAKSQETLEKVARGAGFKNVEFLYEPIAAAFAHETNIRKEKLSLVIDLGGGTSDFTIIRLSADKMRKADRRDDILATSGVRIGGTTFDYRLSLQSFMPALGMGSEYSDLFDQEKFLPVPLTPYIQLSDWAFVNNAQTKKAISDTMDIKRSASEPQKIARLLKLQQNHLGHSLLGVVEDTKIALTKDDTHTAMLRALDPDFAVNVMRKDFEACISEDVERVFSAITECQKKSGTTDEQIDLIVLTGGSTELPMINAMVRARFPQAEISQDNKLDSVGLGLAYRAANLFQAA